MGDGWENLPHQSAGGKAGARNKSVYGKRGEKGKMSKKNAIDFLAETGEFVGSVCLEVEFNKVIKTNARREPQSGDMVVVLMPNGDTQSYTYIDGAGWIKGGKV